MRVLLAEDEPTTRLKLTRLLRSWGCQVIGVNDGEEAWSILQRPDAPSMAILDWMMPKMDGLEICRAVRARGRQYTYLILSTARGGVEDVVAGIEAGVDSYLVKPVDAQELKSRVETGRRVLDLQVQLATARAQSRSETSEDALTGLLNRSAVVRRFNDELNRSRRAGTPVSVILGNLDNFKSVLDRAELRDAILSGVGRAMQECLRDGDSLGYYGDDEYLIIAPGCDASKAGRLAERLRGAVERSRFDAPVTMTFGVVSATFEAADLMLSLSAVTQAMRAAKQEGRNRVGYAVESTEPALVS